MEQKDLSQSCDCCDVPLSQFESYKECCCGTILCPDCDIEYDDCACGNYICDFCVTECVVCKSFMCEECSCTKCNASVCEICKSVDDTCTLHSIKKLNKHIALFL